MRKARVVLAFILLACTGCGIGTGNVDITLLPVVSIAPDPTISASDTHEPELSAVVTPSAADDNKLNSDTIIMRSGLKISDMESYFDLKRGELIQKLGNEYEFVDSGAEGSYRGQYYKELGLTFVYDDYNYSFEEAPLKWIDCDADKLELNGLNPDMNFSQIQERIGTGEIIKEKIEEVIWQYEYWYTLTYKTGNLLLEFRSFNEDGSDGCWVIIDYNFD